MHGDLSKSVPGLLVERGRMHDLDIDDKRQIEARVSRPIWLQKLCSNLQLHALGHCENFSDR
jgi:hypothetical protein